MGQTLVSLEFLFFLLIIFIAYYSLARKCQWQLLLVASYVFYALNNRWEFVFLLAGITVVNFFGGFLIQNASRKYAQKLCLWTCIGLNAGVLLVFKYSKFLGIPIFINKPATNGTKITLLVPLGISFFTFKILSYCIDVYRAKIRCERNIGKFALFISFFPEISSGPIDRAKDFLPQTASPKIYTEDDGTEGIRLMLWGFFKKIVIANNLAIYVNQVYGSPKEYSGIPLVIVTYFLAFQIYADFSGYTDIVRGVGRLFGYRVPENFSSPYFSKSISEFWTRWHITLSAWLRDYLFLPLSFYFSRRLKSPSVLLINSNVAIYFSSALITFFVAGIWHGSAWTFIVWGLLHGFYLSLSNATRSFRKRLRKRFRLHLRYPKLVGLAQTLFCFHIVALSWIFFRAGSLSDALYIIKNILPQNTVSFMREFLNPVGQLQLGASKYGFFIAGLGILFLITVETKQKGREVPGFLVSKKWLIRWGAYYLLLLSIFLLGEFTMKEFIYIQF